MFVVYCCNLTKKEKKIKMQSATAVQPQPQQAGQGGANYPMASLYVGDLGNIFLIIFSLIFVPPIQTD